MARFGHSDLFIDVEWAVGPAPLTYSVVKDYTETRACHGLTGSIISPNEFRVVENETLVGPRVVYLRVDKFVHISSCSIDFFCVEIMYTDN